MEFIIHPNHSSALPTCWLGVLKCFFTFATVVRTLIMLAPHMSIKVIVTIKIMSHTSQLNSSSSCRWLMWAWNVVSRYNYLLHYRGHRQQNKLFNCDMYEQHFDNSDNLNDHISSKHDQSLYKCCECGETFDNEMTLSEHWQFYL